jgi:hypothetical protein
MIQHLVDIISSMTPTEILEQEVLEPPKIITPREFQSFDDLVKFKEDIRQLKLLPVKNDVMYEYYKQFNRDELAEEIIEKFKQYKCDIFSERNKFPYWIPRDVRQDIIWIKENVSDELVINFIHELMLYRRVDLSLRSSFILFERSNRCKSKLVKGTIPQVRHIHFWTKLS